MGTAESPEAELQYRIARALQAPLDEAAVHRFIENTAELLNAPPVMAIGPSLRFRWLVGGRTIQVSAGRGFGRTPLFVGVSAFEHRLVVDRLEYQSFNQWIDMDVPYLWQIELSAPPPEWDPWYPDSPVISSWEDFGSTIGQILQHLPTDYALIPPRWRPRRMGYAITPTEAAPWGTVSFYARTDGLWLYAPAKKSGQPDLDIVIPRAHLEANKLRMTDVAAGVLGGGRLRDTDFFDTDGFSWAPETPGELTNRGVIRPDPDVEDPPRSGHGLDELAALIATPLPDQGARADREYGPLKMTLGLDETIDFIEELLAAVPGPVAPATRPSAEARWRAILERRRLPEDDVTAPVTGRIGFGDVRVELNAMTDFADPRDLCATAWHLSEAFAARHGRPVAWSATTDGGFTRIFDIGGQGVQISVPLGSVEFSIADTESLLAIAFT